MRVLVDTSVWSLALRRPPHRLNREEQALNRTLAELIRNGQVEIIGPIRQEILSGVRHQEQFEKLRTHLQAFVDESVVTLDYEEAARGYNVCRSCGAQCGPVDMLICAVAKRREWAIFSTDMALIRCANTLGIAVVPGRGKRPPEKVK